MILVHKKNNWNEDKFINIFYGNSIFQKIFHISLALDLPKKNNLCDTNKKGCESSKDLKHYYLPLVLVYPNNHHPRSDIPKICINLQIKYRKQSWENLKDLIIHDSIEE